MSLPRITIAALTLALAVYGQGGVPELVSVSSSGQQANGHSPYLGVDISADGRFVVFDSQASNLVSNDTNGKTDVFVHDRRTRQTVCASVDPTGVPGNGDSTRPAISADGRFVAFQSLATNLVPNDDAIPDVFVRDLLLGQTTRVSEPTGGGNANGISFVHAGALSADGRFVAFWSYASNLVAGDKNGWRDVFLHDRATRTTIRVSEALGGGDANGESMFSRISADGGWICYDSGASNLVANDRNGFGDVFLYDRARGLNIRVSVGTGGVEADRGGGSPWVDVGGRLVAFESWATNLVPNDTNGKRDIFVHDRVSNTTRRVSVRSDGGQLNGESSGASIGGGRVTFWTNATNVLDIEKPPYPLGFVHDLVNGGTSAITMTGWGTVPIAAVGGAIAGNGRDVLLYAGSDDLLLHDRNGFGDVFARTIFPALEALDPPRIGTPVRLHVTDPHAAGLAYLALTALDYKPAIPIDRRFLYLAPDPLLFLSASLPAIFQGYSGTLDGQGQATATFRVPNDPILRGLSTSTAFVTFEASAPSGVAGISNTVLLRLW